MPLFLLTVAVTGMIKLALEAGKATPAPPVGPALGSKGVNIMAFCKDYNARTADKAGYVIPVEITVYDVCRFIFLVDSLSIFAFSIFDMRVCFVSQAGDRLIFLSFFMPLEVVCNVIDSYFKRFTLNLYRIEVSPLSWRLLLLQFCYWRLQVTSI